MSDHTFDASDWHERPSIEAYKLVAYVHVGAELARLLQLFVDGSDPMEATDDALAVLDVWRSLEAAALREVVGS
jgi:hypothetical protein